MKHLILITLILFLAGCESGGPTAPETALDATFRGTFTPSAVAANGVCTLEVVALPTGGVPPYRCEWIMAWINQASSARGFPNECSVNISLPDAFGPGLYGFDLIVRDKRNKEEEAARAGTDEELNCGAAVQTTFFGS